MAMPSERPQRARMAGAALAAPWVLVLAWVGRDVFGAAGHTGALIVLQALTAYVDFAVHLGLCHLLLRCYRQRRRWHYCAVIALLSVLIFTLLQFYYLHGINGLGYGRVVVLEDGALTRAGWHYLLVKGAVNAAAHAAAMLVFGWLGRFPRTPATCAAAG